MNKTLLGFILAFLLMVATSATTVTIMTVRQAPPVAVHNDWYANRFSLNTAIKEYSKKGYTVVALTDLDDYFYLVMEKK